jgi:hypothetical protein
MPSSQANESYQYFLFSAPNAGLKFKTGGLPVAFLTKHDTYGTGLYYEPS